MQDLWGWRSDLGYTEVMPRQPIQQLAGQRSKRIIFGKKFLELIHHEQDARQRLPTFDAVFVEPVGVRPNPIEQFFPALKLVVNRATAKIIGLKIPSEFLERVDRIVE